MIEALKACTYAKPKDNKPAEDVAEFDGDDPYDDLRYAVDSAERYFTEAGTEFERVKKQAELTEALINYQDWTAYYRNMRSIEARPKIQAVSRFHHRGR
jgi:dTDP-D-glucose 4,6-dehydratase